MQNTVSAEYIVSTIWQYLNSMRGTLSVNDLYRSVIYVLYGYHKQYNVDKLSNQSFRFTKDDDDLLRDLHIQIKNINDGQVHAIWLYNEITKISYDQFERVYPEVLSLLNEQVSIYGGRAYGDFYTPNEIQSLIAYFVNREGCQSVFDPFCGTASIAKLLSIPEGKVHFIGQDLNQWSTLLARVVLDVSNIENYSVTCTDSLRFWDHEHFDAVISCPPLGVRLSEEQSRMLSYECPIYRTLEDVLFTRPFRINNAKLVVALESLGVTFRSGHDTQLRRFLVENNYLDTIISLPSNLLYGTSIPSVLIICKKNRLTDEPVTFIQADEYFIGEEKRKRTFDINRFVSMYESGNNVDVVKVSVKTIQENDYNLNPNLYSNAKIDLKDGQQVVLVSDLLEPYNSVRDINVTMSDFVAPSLLSNNFIQAILNKNKSVDDDERVRSNSRYYFSSENNSLLLTFDSLTGIRYGLRTGDTLFKCYGPIRVYHINESLVDPEYLVYILLIDPVLNKGGMPLSGYMNHRIVIDKMENQKSIVNKLKLEYDEKMRAEREADTQRLGIKRNISDLEHMIAPTQFKINSIVSRLERAIPSSDNYYNMVKSLKDNVSYMSRIIHYNNVEFTQESFTIKEGNFVDFIKTYADAWKNYGGNYFKLNIVDVSGDIIMSYDATLLTIMLDSILSNAVYHGFHKKNDHTANNTVEISWEKVEYQATSYLCLKVANNGDAMKEGFGIEDYISKGRFSSSTGRSGLGGNHVYQVVKGHNGYFFLDSNKQWNVVVEILLPITESSENLVQYEHECI